MKYVATPISVRQRTTGTAGARRERQPKQRSLLSQVSTMARRYRKVMWADRAFLYTTLLMPVLLGALIRAMPDISSACPATRARAPTPTRSRC